MVLLAPRNKLVFPRGYQKPARWVLDPFHPLSRGLIGFWPLGDSVNGITKDIGPNGANATFVNGPATRGPASFGGESLSLTGSSSQYVSSIPNNLGMSAGSFIPFSVVCYSYKKSSGTQAMAASCNSGATSCAFYLRDGNAGYSSGGAFQQVSITAPSLNAWHHCAVVHYPPGGSARLTYYVDGAAAGTASASGNPDIPAASDFSIGRLGSFNGQYWDGYIDGLRVYNRALSQAEIQWLQREPWAGVYRTSDFFVGVTSQTVSLSGVSATAAAGTLGVTRTGSVGLTGAQATAAAGTFGIQIDRTLGLSGVSATAFTGSLGISIGANVFLVGTQATGFAGTLSPVAVADLYVPLITIMNNNPIPISGDMSGDYVANQADMPSQVALETILSTAPIPMTGTLSADPVANEGSVP